MFIQILLQFLSLHIWGKIMKKHFSIDISVFLKKDVLKTQNIF